ADTEGIPYDDLTLTQGGRAATPEDKKKNLSHVFKTYYLEYVRGNYVDRTGTKFNKPEIKKNVGNDVIAAALSIFIDSIGDTQVRTPIFKNGNKYYPSETTDVPTAAAKGFITVLDISTKSDKCGITEPEAKAIGFLSNLAGDKSAL